MHLIIPHGFEANYVLGFVRGLAENRARFKVVSDDEIAPRLEAVGIPHLNLRGSVDPRRRLFIKVANYLVYYAKLLLEVFRHRGQTIHFIGILRPRPLLLEAILISAWIRVWAGRYVHTVHNALPHGRSKSRWYFSSYRWIYRLPHILLTHTQMLADQLRDEFGVKMDRLAIISIGLNEEVPLSSRTRAEAREQLGLPAESKMALFFGKVEPYKGLDLLIAAWAKLETQATFLRVVGESFSPAYSRAVREAMLRSPRTEQIRWEEGFLPNNRIALWLQATDVVVLPYRHIYQSGVVFLCLRFGVPMVATRVGSLDQYIDSDSGLLVPPEDPAGLAAGLDKFFAESDRYDRAVIARRAEKYRWTHQCSAIRRWYV